MSRRRFPSGFSILATLWIVCAFCLCGAAARPAAQRGQAELVWPPPPEQARIAYVQSIERPSDAGARSSAWSRISRWVTGSEKGNERLNKPFGIAIDENDNLLLTDTGANVVCYFDRAKNKWHRWSQIGKLPLLSPVSAACCKNVFYVADSTRASVLAFNEAGKLLFQITNKLERPSGLVISQDRLFVADSKRHCVAAFDLAGNYLTEFGRRGNGPGEFNFPSHIAADIQGNLYVTDAINSRVQLFNREGQFQRQFGKIGDGPGSFSRPKGVAVDSAGRIHVVDALFDNIQIFDREGQLLLNLGEGGTGAGKFWLPNGVAISRKNEIFVADCYNHRVQVFKYLREP